MEALSTLYEYIKYYSNPNAGACIKRRPFNGTFKYNT